MYRTTFTTVIKGFGNNTGIQVPLSALEELGSSKRPPVNVKIGNYEYKSTVGVMSGMYLITLSKAHREATGLKAGNKVMVTLELDDGVREVVIPRALKRILDKERLTDVFNNLAYSKRKEFARQVNEAKAEDTRERRIVKIINLIQSSQQQ